MYYHKKGCKDRTEFSKPNTRRKFFFIPAVSVEQLKRDHSGYNFFLRFLSASFSCVCAVIDHEFGHKIVKVAVDLSVCLLTMKLANERTRISAVFRVHK